MMRPRWMTAALLLFIAIGIGLSAVSLVNHYKTDPTSYCSFDETFNCDIVNRSIYSQFPAESRYGVPVAAIGLTGYLAMAVLALVPRRRASVALFLAALAGLGFSLYLTYLEANVLHAWCILCLGSSAAVVMITVLSGLGLISRRRLATDLHG
jgi:uncharacterized membrane protein